MRMGDSPFPSPAIRLAVAASSSVYGVTREGIEKQLSEFQNPYPVRVVCSDPGSFTENIKNWALVTSTQYTAFAIRGSTLGLDHAVNLDCLAVPFEIGSQVCNPGIARFHDNGSF
jgi:hypothetical protein